MLWAWTMKEVKNMFMTSIDDKSRLKLLQLKSTTASDINPLMPTDHIYYYYMKVWTSGPNCPPSEPNFWFRRVLRLQTAVCTEKFVAELYSYNPLCIKIGITNMMNVSEKHTPQVTSPRELFLPPARLCAVFLAL